VAIARIPIDLYFHHLDAEIAGPADVALLVVRGLASPFLRVEDNPMAVIGLLILFVGIRIAWQMTAEATPSVIGPFENRAGSALPSATT
jgi:hypothetical protein